MKTGIFWIPQPNIEHSHKKIDRSTWEVFAQQDILIRAKETKPIDLLFGFKTRGVVVCDLLPKHRSKDLIILNGIFLYDQESICPWIQNHSNSSYTIKKGEPLVRIHYLD